MSVITLASLGTSNHMLVILGATLQYSLSPSTASGGWEPSVGHMVTVEQVSKLLAGTGLRRHVDQKQRAGSCKSVSFSIVVLLMIQLTCPNPRNYDSIV